MNFAEHVAVSSFELDSLDFKLPVRNFKILYKVAEEGKFSLTIEFLLRLLKALNSVTIQDFSDFFGFTTEEALHVVTSAERLGLVGRSADFIMLTEVGKSKFNTVTDEPSLYNVTNKTKAAFFDMLSFSPIEHDSLDHFANTLPEIQILSPELASNPIPSVKESFVKNYFELVSHYRENNFKKSFIYAIDDIVPLNRSSVLVHLSVKLSSENLNKLEIDFSGWKSTEELQDRLNIVDGCYNLIKNKTISIPRSMDFSVDFLQELSPQHIDKCLKDGKIDHVAFLNQVLKSRENTDQQFVTRLFCGSVWCKENTIDLLYLLNSTKCEPVTNQIWIKPDIEFWGCTTKLMPLIQSFFESGIDSTNTTAGNSYLMTSDKNLKTTQWRFKYHFNEIISPPYWDFPFNFEMLLIPNRVVVALCYLPLVAPVGFPIPLGLMSSDPDIVLVAHDYLQDLINNNLRNHESHSSDLTSLKRLAKVIK